jgi:hypothetical protein
MVPRTTKVTRHTLVASGWMNQHPMTVASVDFAALLWDAMASSTSFL